MATPNNKKFSWLIKNFSSLPSDQLLSAPVSFSDINWNLKTYPKGYSGGDSLIVYLDVAGAQSWPSGWRRYVRFHLTIVNQRSDELSIHREIKCLFEWKTPGHCLSLLPLDKLHAKDGGFLVNDELLMIAEVEALEVIGTLDEYKEATKTVTKIKQDDDAKSKNLLEKTSSVKEIIDVNGFQVLHSQVESVKRIFEKHPDIAQEVRSKNQHVRAACMNFLLSLTEILPQSLQESLSDEDQVEATIALTCLKKAGFKVDWFEKNLVQACRDGISVLGQLKLSPVELKGVHMRRSLGQSVKAQRRICYNRLR